MPRIAIIGGGYAGMAAAVTLARNNISVEVFEAAKELGGRARRIQYNGVALDNGQHILIGAYRETLRLIREVTVADDISLRLKSLPFEINLPGRFRLKTFNLPAPWHLVFALAKAEGLTWAERLSAAKFMRQLQTQKFRLDADCSVSELLKSHRQNKNLVELIWAPLCIAALNTPPDQASAQIFLNVLRDSLSKAKNDSDLLLPKTDLSALFPEAAAAWIEQRGSKVHRSATVMSITEKNSEYTLHFRNEEMIFTHIICAVAPQHLPRLVEHLPQLRDTADMVDKYTYQPIYTIYLQYPDHVSLPRPMIALEGEPAQWAFDRGQLGGAPGLVAVVVSAEGSHQDMPHDKLAELAHQQIAKVVAIASAPLWHKVIAEKRATYSCTPNLPRPSQKTPYPNFYLAGDYTEASYPATIEAAVRSGVTSAQYLLSTLGEIQ